MKTIKMETTSAGPDGVMLPGKPYTISAEKADALIKGNYAKAVVDNPKSSPEIEKAIIVPKENSAAPAAPAAQETGKEASKASWGSGKK